MSLDDLAGDLQEYYDDYEAIGKIGGQFTKEQLDNEITELGRTQLYLLCTLISVALGLNCSEPNIVTMSFMFTIYWIVQCMYVYNSFITNPDVLGTEALVKEAKKKIYQQQRIQLVVSLIFFGFLLRGLQVNTKDAKGMGIFVMTVISIIVLVVSTSIIMFRSNYL